MQDERSLPVRRVQDRDEGRRHRVHGADTVGTDQTTASRWVSPGGPPLYDALIAVLRPRVAQRAARTLGAQPPLVGHLCEPCQDAPAVLLQPAPWGGEMGVCAACQQEPPAGDTPPQTTACGRMDLSPTTRGLRPV